MAGKIVKIKRIRYELGHLTKKLGPLLEHKYGRRVLFTPLLATEGNNKTFVTHSKVMFDGWSGEKRVDLELYEDKLCVIGDKGFTDRIDLRKFDLDNEVTHEYIADKIISLI